LPQALFLAARNYNVILVQWETIWTCDEWVDSFGRLLDELQIDGCHLIGASLGGFLAQVFAAEKPHRVLSVVLINSFCDTSHFTVMKPLMGFNMCPDFYLKKLVLENFNTQAIDPDKVDAIDFVVEHFEQLCRTALAGRLHLMCTYYELGSLCLPPEHLTILNSFDTAHNSCRCQCELYDKYPEGRVADIKCGGDFPYLAYSDDVNLHILVHLRHVGCRTTNLPISPAPAHEESSNDEINDNVEPPLPEVMPLVAILDPAELKGEDPMMPRYATPPLKAETAEEPYDASYVLQRAAPGLSLAGETAGPNDIAGDMEEEPVENTNAVIVSARPNDIAGEMEEEPKENTNNVIVSEPVDSDDIGSDVWDQIRDESSGDVYFYNKLTGESQWSPPSSPNIAPTDPTTSAAGGAGGQVGVSTD